MKDKPKDEIAELEERLAIIENIEGISEESKRILKRKQLIEALSPPLKETDVYLGDGVYASFDGYQIELKANDHYAPTDKVYLCPEVIDRFLNYVDFLKNKIQKHESERLNQETN